MRRREKKEYGKAKQPQWSKATTTNLVKDVFETLFTGQLDKNDLTDEKVYIKEF